MRRLLAAIALTLALPAATAAKGPVLTQLCGPDECRDIGPVSYAFDARPHAPPRAGRYYELRFGGGGHASRGIYYEPRSALVAYSQEFGNIAWAPLVGPPLETAGLEPYPAPRVAAAWVGDTRVSGDPSGYLQLVTLSGPFVVPEHPTAFEWIRLESPTPNPWTSQPLVYYPRDRVLLVPGATYVQVPDAVAADLAAAHALDDESGRTTLPWIALATAVGGAVALLLLRTLGVWSGSLRPSSSSTSSGRRRWRPARTRRSSAAA